jgi:hypothetical protein
MPQVETLDAVLVFKDIGRRGFFAASLATIVSMRAIFSTGLTRIGGRTAASSRVNVSSLRWGKNLLKAPLKIQK